MQLTWYQVVGKRYSQDLNSHMFSSVIFDYLPMLPCKYWIESVCKYFYRAPSICIYLNFSSHSRKMVAIISNFQHWRWSEKIKVCKHLTCYPTCVGKQCRVTRRPLVLESHSGLDLGCTLFLNFTLPLWASVSSFLNLEKNFALSLLILKWNVFQAPIILHWR